MIRGPNLPKPAIPRNRKCRFQAELRTIATVFPIDRPVIENIIPVSGRGHSLRIGT
jgi:hypothetical protein